MADSPQPDRPAGPLRLEPPAGAPRRTAYEYVGDALRQGILEGGIEAGTRLVQTEIAQQLGVSTTPVREALRDLATEGLVRLDAHRGGIVSRLSDKDLLEIHELCRLVEPEAMRQVVSMADAVTLQGAYAFAREMQVETDPVRWTQLNRNFHGQLLDAIPSERFRSLLKTLRGSVAPYVAMASRKQGSEHFNAANQEHLEILEAITAGDADRCADLTRKHVDLTLRVLDLNGHRLVGNEPVASA